MKNYYFNQNLKFSIENENKQKILNPNQVRIRMRNCGICGSDIHYFLYGENGGRKIQEPLILGHEAAGEILEVGSNIKHLKVSDRVAINPALYCNKCNYCKGQKFHLCENVLFFGSASKMPHTQGAFREQLIVLTIPLSSIFEKLLLVLINDTTILPLTFLTFNCSMHDILP